jgi:hypothetical protein
MTGKPACKSSIRLALRLRSQWLAVTCSASIEYSEQSLDAGLDPTTTADGASPGISPNQAEMKAAYASDYASWDGVRKKAGVKIKDQPTDELSQRESESGRSAIADLEEGFAG